MDFEYSNVLVFGLGKSGQAVVDYLKENNVSYKVFDESKSKCADYKKLSKKILSNFDLIVLSPGVSIYNKYVVMTKSLNIEVVGEIEFAFRYIKKPIIAITGTNGKTTTTKLVNDIISKKYSSVACGNIGTPLTSVINNSVDYFVCEVSSFQLESVNHFRPEISVILNLAEDHLDRHKTFENYINCKINLLKNNNKHSINILNGEDKLLVEKTKDVLGRTYYFSKHNKVNGVYVSDETIYSNVRGKEEKIISMKDIGNVYNIIDDVLASILVGEILKVDREDILNTIKSFETASHRLEVVYEKNNMKYIDDSKSTNIHSSIHALNNTNGDIVLLLGGKNKGLSFDQVFSENIANLKYVIAFGKARKDIVKSAKKYNFDNIIAIKKFYDAVKYSCNNFKDNYTILMSPGCASFDEFNNYAERGIKFSSLVKEFNNDQK